MTADVGLQFDKKRGAVEHSQTAFCCFVHRPKRKQTIVLGQRVLGVGFIVKSKSYSDSNFQFQSYLCMHFDIG